MNEFLVATKCKENVRKVIKSKCRGFTQNDTTNPLGSTISFADLIFNITLDGDVGRIGFGAGSVDAQDSVVRGSISLLKTAERCRTYRVYVKVGLVLLVLR